MICCKRALKKETWGNDQTKKKPQRQSNSVAATLRFPFIQGTMPGLPVTSMKCPLLSQRACRSRAVCLPTRLSARAVTKLSMHCEILTSQLDLFQLAGYRTTNHDYAYKISYEFVGYKPRFGPFGQVRSGIPDHEIRVRTILIPVSAEGLCQSWLACRNKAQVHGPSAKTRTRSAERTVARLECEKSSVAAGSVLQ